MTITFKKSVLFKHALYKEFFVKICQLIKEAEPPSSPKYYES